MQEISRSPAKPSFTLYDAPVPAAKQTQVRDSLLVTRARLGFDTPAESCDSVPSTSSRSSALPVDGGARNMAPPDTYSPVQPSAEPGFYVLRAKKSSKADALRIVTPASLAVRAQGLNDPLSSPDSAQPIQSHANASSTTGTLPRWGRAIHRALHASGPQMSTDQRAVAVHQWLRVHELFVASRTKPKQRLRELCGDDALQSVFFAQPEHETRAGLTWLDSKNACALQMWLIDRAHAELCGPDYVVPILLEALRSFFRVQARPKKAGKPALQVFEGRFSGLTLTYLRSLHIGGVAFQQDAPQHTTQYGAWCVGLTSVQQPLAVKIFDKASLARSGSQALGAARRAQYLVRHETDARLYLVTPMYRAVLQDVASIFLEKPQMPSMRRPQAASAAPRLEGARYLFREVARAVRQYHRDSGRPHGSIRSAVMFIDTSQKRLVLADDHTRWDAGLDDARDALRYPQDECPPEQIAGMTPTEQCDAFGVCNMMMRLLLQHAPEVKKTWQALHPDAAMPQFLLGGYNLGFAQKVFGVWSRAHTTEREAAVAQAACLSHIPLETKRLCVARFEAIDQVMQRVDDALWRLLQRGLRGDTQSGLKPQQSVLHIGRHRKEASGDETMLVDAIWRNIPDYPPDITTALTRLREDHVRSPIRTQPPVGVVSTP